jgi:hypothetical protein
VNLFTMQFDYDFMVMSDMRNLEPLPEGKGMPPVGGAPGEAAPTGRAPGSLNPQGGGDFYSRTLAAIGGRAAAKLTNEALGKYIRQVPGLGSVADTIGGLVTQNVGGAILGVGGAINQSFAAPTRDLVVDRSTVSSDQAQAVVGRPRGGG